VVQVRGYRVLVVLLGLMTAHAKHHRDDDYAGELTLVFALQVRVALELVAPQHAAVLPAQHYGHAAASYCGAQVFSLP
jgi:hypothetical protein